MSRRFWFGAKQICPPPSRRSSACSRVASRTTSPRPAKSLAALRSAAGSRSSSSSKGEVMASKDATVTSQDLFDVGAEIAGQPLEQTARRLRDLEPAIVAHIDAAAELMAGRLATAGVGIEHVRHVATELRRL